MWTHFSFFSKFFAGYQILETDTEIKNDEQQNNQQDEDEPDYIAKSNVASDGAFDYGIGIGMRFPIFRNLEKGPIFLSLEMKWSKGGIMTHYLPQPANSSRQWGSVK